MIYDISKPIPDTLEYNNAIFKFSLPFDRVLEFFNVITADSLLTEEEKLEVVYSWFVIGHERVQIKKKVAIMRRILNEYINFTGKQKNSNEPECVSFSQDCGYIYAAFMMDYGIDLFAEQGKLHWWKFIALFQGLSEKTKIREIMSIRARPIPAATKYNSEERAELCRLKAYYALNVDEKTTEQRANNAWNKLFDIMESKTR